MDVDLVSTSNTFTSPSQQPYTTNCPQLDSINDVTSSFSGTVSVTMVLPRSNCNLLLLSIAASNGIHGFGTFLSQITSNICCSLTAWSDSAHSMRHNFIVWSSEPESNSWYWLPSNVSRHLTAPLWFWYFFTTLPFSTSQTVMLTSEAPTMTYWQSSDTVAHVYLAYEECSNISHVILRMTRDCSTADVFTALLLFWVKSGELSSLKTWALTIEHDWTPISHLQSSTELSVTTTTLFSAILKIAIIQPEVLKLETE